MSTFIKTILVSAGMAVMVAVTYAQTAPAEPANPAIPEAASSPQQGGSNADALARLVAEEYAASKCGGEQMASADRVYR